MKHEAVRSAVKMDQDGPTAPGCITRAPWLQDWSLRAELSGVSCALHQDLTDPEREELWRLVAHRVAIEKTWH